MPRIRTLKPEHRQHRKVGPLSDRIYRLWVGMILEADDEGRLICDAGQLRAVIFAYHQKIRPMDVESMLTTLESVGLIHLYLFGDKRIAQLHDWEDHQTARQSWSFTPSRLPNQAGEVLDLGIKPNDAARWAIYERDHFTCVYCAADLHQRMKEITLDHVIPIAGGGCHLPLNLTTACRRCNVKKNGRTPAEAGMPWPDGLGAKAIIQASNPRPDGVQTGSRRGPVVATREGVPEVPEGLEPELQEPELPHTVAAAPRVRVEPNGFVEFWAMWPSSRQVGKADALKAWRALDPAPSLRQVILAAVEAAKQGREWQREGGRYIPHPHRWLSKRRWEDAPPAAQATLLTEKTQGNQAAAEALLRRMRPP